MVKKLKNSVPVVYLAGAIEKCPNFGRNWREDITPFLVNSGYKVCNPCIEELPTVTPERLQEAKRTDFNAYKNYLDRIVLFDLNLVLRSDIVVCKIDEYTLKGAGTFGELTMCRYKDIPVYAWIDLPEGEYQVPGWALGCVTKYSTTKEEFLKLIPKGSNLVAAEKLESEKNIDEFVEEWKKSFSDM